MSEVLKQLFSNDKADEIVSAISAIGLSDNGAVEYAKNIGLCLINLMDNITWENSSAPAYIQALREAVYDVPEPSQALPYGYVKHDYIEKYTGTVRNMKPLIQIKEYPNIYEKGIDITFGYNPEAGATLSILGARIRSSSVSDNSQSFAFYTDKSGVFMHLYGNASTSIVSSGVTQGPNLVKFRPQPGGAVVSVNNQSTTVSGSYSTTLNLPGLGVSANCAYYSDDSQSDAPSIIGGARVGNIKIYDGDVVIGNYVPCLRTSDNVVGLYDMVDKTFYTSERLTYATQGSTDCIYRVGEW